LALELAERHTSPLSAEARGTSEFPVWRNPPAAEQIERKIGCVDPAAKDIILGLQPHQAPDPDRDLLHTLNRLCNIDKHQTLHLVGMTKTGLDINPGGGSVSNIRYVNGPLYDGAELVRFTATPNPQTEKVEVQLAVTARVAFAEGPPGFEEPVSKLLFDIKQYIANAIYSPLARFLPPPT
jgi:hypothetical protein